MKKEVLQSENTTAKQIIYISTDKLFPHPNNPRSDLGDLTELADSIKTNGVLQNLTVVPTTPKSNKYTIVIGHRRHAAANLAGLKELPCIITEMTPQKQIATMLLENMQRNELNLYEQAQGIQLMLNMGESVKAISEQTGFSETTVRRRVKLAELDKSEFRKSISRGATLQDYLELEKIKDVSKRNKVLENIGTANFRWELNRATREEKQAEDKKKAINMLNCFAIKTNNSAGLIRESTIYPSEYDKIKKPANAGNVRFYYADYEHYIVLYRDPTEAEQSKLEAEAEQSKLEAEAEEQNKRTAEQEHRDQCLSECKEVAKQAYNSRYDFIKNYSESRAKKNIDGVLSFATKSTLEILDTGFCLDKKIFADMLNIEEDKLDWGENIIVATVDELLKAAPAKTLLVAAYSHVDDDEHSNYISYDGTHNENEELDYLYEALIELGYEMSDEEKAMQDGTHEKLFKHDE